MLTLMEAGKSVSTANQQKIKVAMTALNDLLDKDEEPPVQEAAKIAVQDGKIEDRDDIANDLEKLIRTMSTVAQEQMEGDGDNDVDPVHAVVQGHLGDALIPEAARDELLGMIGEARVRLRERAFSPEQRVALAKAGKAIPIKNDKGEVIGGRYPIENADDLKNAKMAYGRSASAAVKAHINKMAKTLGKAAMGSAAKESAVVEAAGGLACANCSEPVPSAWSSYCPACGSSLLKKPNKNQFCSGCGNMMGASDKYCAGCGAEAPSDMGKAKEAAIDDADLNIEFTPLVEKAVGRDGTMQIKLISPGWGSSGYYHPDVLKKDGPSIFTEGTKMFWNHPTKAEERDRPERDLRDLAAVTTGPSVYLEEGKKGPGLYAIAKPVTTYRGAIEDLAEHIGVSINASGRVRNGSAEGKSGPIVEAITRRKSVDFVTEPGAGGEICQLFEAKGRERTPEPITQPIKEAGTQVDDEATLKEARNELKEARNENARLRERILLRDAREMATEQINKVEGLRAPSRRRLIEQVIQDPAHDEDGELDKPVFRADIKEAVRREMRYIDDLTQTGRPRDMGGSRDFEESRSYDELDEDDDFSERSDEDGPRFNDRPRLVESRRRAEPGADGKTRFERETAADYRRLGLTKDLSEAAAAGR